MFVLVLVLLVIAVVFLFCLIYGGETQNEMFGDARDRLTFFRLQLRASERERERGELCTIMEKDVGKPQVFLL